AKRLGSSLIKNNAAICLFGDAKANLDREINFSIASDYLGGSSLRASNYPKARGPALLKKNAHIFFKTFVGSGLHRLGFKAARGHFHDIFVLLQIVSRTRVSEGIGKFIEHDERLPADAVFHAALHFLHNSFHRSLYARYFVDDVDARTREVAEFVFRVKYNNVRYARDFS